MAEPAPIYDPGQKKASTEPGLEALEGGGETSPPTGNLSAVPNRVGRGYRPDNPQELSKMKPSVAGVFGFAKKNRGKLVLGGATASFLTLLIVGFFALLPFKILHIVNNLQSRFFASSENAVQNETDVLFSDYLRRHVMPGLNTCRGSTIDMKCTPKDIAGNSIVSKLYGGWKTGRLENKLAEKYGLEFKSVNGNFYIKTRGMTGDGVSLGDEKSGFMTSNQTLDDFMAKDSRFQKVSRSQLRQSYKDALANETKWKQVMYRYKVGGLLAKKYGLKRCIIACGTRDNFNDWKDSKNRAAKMILAERVLAPRSETLALVIQCIIDTNCKPSDRSQTDSEGRKISDTQAKLQAKLTELAAQNTGKYADVVTHSEGILKDGYKTYIVKQVAKSIVGHTTDAIEAQTTEKVAGNLVPVIGWANTAFSTIHALKEAPDKVRALSYATNAVAMVSTYTTYRVFADEAKNGNIDPAILGSFTDSLGPSDKTALGGTASAEQSPLYANIIDGVSTQKNGSSYYKCNDGKPVSSGSSVCPEEILNGDNGVVSAIKTLSDGLGPMNKLADFWYGTVGIPFRAVAQVATYITSGVLQTIYGYPQLLALVSDAAKPIIGAFTDYLIPSPFSDNMGGARTFDMMAGGADVSGNDYAQNGLGGKELSPAQATAILNEQTRQNIQSYKSQPFLAKIFDTDSQYSLVSRIAVAMPSNLSSAAQAAIRIFSNPFGTIGRSFAALFFTDRVFAAAAQADPFGITQYGYPADDPNMAAANADPEKYWTENCSTDGTTIDWSKGKNAAWQDTATLNEATGLYENTSTNPCLLLQAAIGSAGALYNSGLLATDDLTN